MSYCICCPDYVYLGKFSNCGTYNPWWERQAHARRSHRLGANEYEVPDPPDRCDETDARDGSLGREAILCTGVRKAAKKYVPRHVHKKRIRIIIDL
jgi:hypothetical protein